MYNLAAIPCENSWITITINKDTSFDNQELPWFGPQLIRYKAKNAYKVKNSVVNIQREIFERGPVTTGFNVYPDF